MTDEEPKIGDNRGNAGKGTPKAVPVQRQWNRMRDLEGTDTPGPSLRTTAASRTPRSETLSIEAAALWVGKFADPEYWPAYAKAKPIRVSWDQVTDRLKRGSGR
jgi:hypothetical protein